MTQTVTESVTEQEPTTGPAQFAHYAFNPTGEVSEAYINRTPLEALCGYVWVPEKVVVGLPVCPECKAVYDDNEAMLLHKARIERGEG